MGLFGRNKNQQAAAPVAPATPGHAPSANPAAANQSPQQHAPSYNPAGQPMPQPLQTPMTPQQQLAAMHQQQFLADQQQKQAQYMQQHAGQHQQYLSTVAAQQQQQQHQQHQDQLRQQYMQQLHQHQQQQQLAQQYHGQQPYSSGGHGGGASWLYQAAQEAANQGRPLTLNFVAQQQATIANRPYGVAMPPPYNQQLDPALYGMGGGGPPAPLVAAQASAQARPASRAAALPAPLSAAQAAAAGLPPGWQPGVGANPYEAIRLPALPDMRDLPPELQDFRDQCATGVRQAVAMITAMEHQLWWERSRRQEAEEDCKVLLGAVHAERGLGDALLGAEERRREEARALEGKLKLAAEELPQANGAATTIQKHVRGRLARKEFEGHLRDILRGVDPLLDPAGLPASAQHHLSSVNATGAPRKLGMRTLLGADGQGNVGVNPQGVAEGGGLEGLVGPDTAQNAAYYRRQVDRIGQRMSAHKDAGAPNPNDFSGDPLQADVKQLLTGTYPASSAQVIAALVRRCRELQAALVEAVANLEESELSIKGLKEANTRLSELSAVRSDLEIARNDNMRLAATVAKLRTFLTTQATAANATTAKENPYVAAWYRKAYAESEWQKVPPGGPGGVALLDGPDTAVETWDDLRGSIPEPVLMPRVATPGSQYKDLLALKQDMIMAAAQGPPDPLYSMAVPDSSSFVYERDTPLIPTQSPMPIIRESMPTDAFMGLHDEIHRRTPHTTGASAPGSGAASARSAAATPRDAGGTLLPSSAAHIHPQWGQQQQQGGMGVYDTLAAQDRNLQQQAEWERAQLEAELDLSAGATPRQQRSGGGAFAYGKDTPLVPMYSVLPYIREDDYIYRTSLPGTQPRQLQQAQQQQPPATPPYQSRTFYPTPPAMDTNLPYVRDTVPVHSSPQTPRRF